MPSPLTAEHRAQQLALRALVLRETLRLWPALDPTRLDATFPAWAAAVAALVRARRPVSAALARRYLERLRAQAGLSGPPPTPDPPALDSAALGTSLRVVSITGVKSATGRGVPLRRAVDAALVRTSGVVGRHVLDAGRDVVRASTAADPRSPGWRRVTGAAACDWCRMLATRGGVYTAGTAQFQSHDHCSCQCEPVYE